MLGAPFVAGFGWGRRGGEGLPDDPRQWLADQLAAPDGARFPGLGDSADGLIALRTQRMEKMQGDPLVKPVFQAEVASQLGNILTTDQPFRDRLCWFWMNHFTVSVRQGGTRAVIGAYMREAIRPHVTGRFADMLCAVMRHPAMLMYLDNTGSIGPDSRAGLRQRKGLNENLARECLELHTVSPAAGYSQADVTRFAAILTGWGVDMKAARPGFLFRANAHEPGEKTLMGRSFPEGEEGGLMALEFLGTHPATYRHIALKLVTHFIADEPAPSDVTRITAVLHETGGDLKAASLALGDLPAARRPGRKFRSPMEYGAAALRALDLGFGPIAPENGHAPPKLFANVLSSLGQPLWTAPLPNGWSDKAADWSAPADMIARVDWAYRLAAIAPEVDPPELARDVLGPALRRPTLEAIRHAGSRREALTLLFTSPEFQRR
ncbi:DUF1800 domain-containing protein [Acidomonas methanolica]|uniref:DUF1800 domain-containing protein n=1 Tax=Acidomonas methanolica TaxID=437 RepID=UPI00211A6124|nr:DUF1800 domain-containing protein [Acidomonas methanolica]MCQ9155306.1 DUF1800 domain-containing protein [Acidomonas methanolica]